MTKEELEHNHIKEIAEKYIHESWGSYLDLDEVDLVLAGIGVAKIISKEKDERIEELEAQIEKMQETLKSDLIARLKENISYSTSPSCTKGMELFIKSIV